MSAQTSACHAVVVGGGFAAGGATGVQGHGMASTPTGAAPGNSMKMQRTSSNLFVLAEHVLVAQQVAEAQFLGLELRLGASVKRAILGPQLLGGVTCHPEGFFVGHCWFRPGVRSRLVAA